MIGVDKHTYLFIYPPRSSEVETMIGVYLAPVTIAIIVPACEKR